MWEIWFIAILELLIIIFGIMLHVSNAKEKEEDSEKLELLVNANTQKTKTIDSIVEECDKAMKVNNYNNVYATLRKIKELAVRKNN